MHKSKETEEFLKNGEIDIELVFLPTYSPHLNPIEGKWRSLKEKVTKAGNLQPERCPAIHIESGASIPITLSTSFNTILTQSTSASLEFLNSASVFKTGTSR